MAQWIIAHELWIRLGCFAGVLMIVALWEQLAPRRRPSAIRGRRWLSHLGLSLLNTLVLRLLLPLTAVGMALLAEREGWGLLHRYHAPAWLVIALSIIALDLVIYLQHVMFHAVPAFWRLHRVHHADVDFDVSTGIRFHPIEILLSMLIKFSAIVAIGTPALAVFVFEVLLNASSLFNHGNVRLPLAIDRGLRWLVVTPDMHRVHHSIVAHETNSNFGFNLPWWDRLFGTYQAQPQAGHEAMTIGIETLRDEHLTSRLLGLLVLPFQGATGEYPINRRWK
ncbi:MAG: sterol desaturase family protein [Gammaproteobacteria bacterium]|nr:sterol desaturase family protein [Gammaproteobacteria bacterium]